MEEDKTQEAVTKLTNYMNMHGGHSEGSSSKVFYYIIIIIYIYIYI